MNTQDRKSIIRDHNRASGQPINDPAPNPDHGMSTLESVFVVLIIAAVILAAGVLKG